jgi:hypothetical protein
MTTVFWMGLSALAAIHLLVECFHLSLIWRARKALSPHPSVMRGVCTYKISQPPSGPPDEIYCQHPKHPRVVDSPEVCYSCDERKLPLGGGNHFDSVLFDDFRISVTKRLVSCVMGIVPLILGLLKLYLDLCGYGKT